MQLDSDGDGVNDAEDAFKFDANESVDTDNDGVADRWDAYPEDPTRSQAEVENRATVCCTPSSPLLLLGLLVGRRVFLHFAKARLDDKSVR